MSPQTGVLHRTNGRGFGYQPEWVGSVYGIIMQGDQRVAALGVEPLHLRFVQGGSPVHAIHLQVHVDGHDHAGDRVRDLGIRCLSV